MQEFYTRFYSVVQQSPAHHVFCERAYGLDLCQHGFADLEQLELFLRLVPLDGSHHVLDLGCGNGMLTEYLSDRSGARFTGLDFIPGAIRLAQSRTALKSGRLTFIVGDINQLELPPAAYDVILSVDSIYFSQDYAATISRLKASLKPHGQMALFYSYGREPWVPVEEFPREKLPPDKTPLAEALQANALACQAWDLTHQDYELALKRKAILQELKPQFEAEGIQFIYENRLGDSMGVAQAVEAGLHARYFYQVRLPDSG